MKYRLVINYLHQPLRRKFQKEKKVQGYHCNSKQKEIQFLYNHPDICTSSSAAAGAGAAGAGASADSLATIVFRKGSIVLFSRIRNAPPETSFVSFSLLGPTIPIEVLLMLSSLSC